MKELRLEKFLKVTIGNINKQNYVLRKTAKEGYLLKSMNYFMEFYSKDFDKLGKNISLSWLTLQ